MHYFPLSPELSCRPGSRAPCLSGLRAGCPQGWGVSGPQHQMGCSHQPAAFARARAGRGLLLDGSLGICPWPRPSRFGSSSSEVGPAAGLVHVGYNLVAAYAGGTWLAEALSAHVCASLCQPVPACAMSISTGHLSFQILLKKGFCSELGLLNPSCVACRVMVPVDLFMALRSPTGGAPTGQG